MDSKEVLFYFLFPDRATGLLQPHLGSDFLVNLLIKNGYEASRLLSAEGQFPNQVFDEIKVDSKKIYIFGITCYDANYQLVKFWVHHIKSRFPDCFIFVGGPTATFSDDVILLSIPGVDLCVRGEGERKITTIAQYLNEGKDLKNITGTSYVENGQLVRIADDGVLSNEEMNSYPTPLSEEEYIRQIFQRYGKISILTSRGCPHQCHFCAFSIQSQRKVRFYSPDRVIEQIKLIARALSNMPNGTHKRVVIEDDCFTLIPSHFNKIIDAIIELKPDLQFECETRPDYVTYETLCRLKEAGFCRVDVSLESSDPEVLVQSGKIHNLAAAKRFIEQVEKVMTWCKELGMQSFTTVLCGLPGDTPEKLLNTVHYIQKIKPTGYFWNNLRVFAGTTIYTDRFKKLIEHREIEARLNPVVCNDITYNNISLYDPRRVERPGDDSSRKDRNNTMIDTILRAVSGWFCSTGTYLVHYGNLDILTDIDNLIITFPLDTTLIWVKSENGHFRVTSFRLSELLSVAGFGGDIHQIRNTLLDMAPFIEVGILDEEIQGIEMSKGKGQTFIDLCLLGAPCPVKNGNRYYVEDNGEIKTCLKGKKLGNIGEPLEVLGKRFSTFLTEAKKKNQCDNCSALGECNGCICSTTEKCNATALELKRIRSLAALHFMEKYSQVVRYVSSDPTLI